MIELDDGDLSVLAIPLWVATLGSMLLGYVVPTIVCGLALIIIMILKLQRDVRRVRGEGA